MHRRQRLFVVGTLAYIEGIPGQASSAHRSRTNASGRACPSISVPHLAGSDGLVQSEASVNAAAIASLHHARVPILAGADATPFAPRHGVSMLGELLLYEAGLSPVEALAEATNTPARHFGLDDQGRIEPSLRADLDMVEGDPAEDARDGRSIEQVWRRGVEKRIA